MSFIRNHIPKSQRIEIGLTAHQNRNIYGAITELALAHHVSRWFIYFCQQQYLLLLFLMDSVQTPEQLFSNLSIEEMVLSLYLEGESSVDGIRRVLLSHYGKSVSVGQISKILNHYGKGLSECSIEEALKRGLLLLVIDELFVNGSPILVIVDPVSLYIYEILLVNKRDQITWGKSLTLLVDEGKATRVTADEGTAIRAAVDNVFGSNSYCSDHYHLLCTLKKILLKLAKKVADAAKAREKAGETFADAKGREVKKALKEYEKACQAEKEASQIYENLSYLFTEFCEQLRPVDKEKGSLRNEKEAIKQCQAILELMSEINNEEVQKEATRLMKKLPVALCYLKEAPKVLERLEEIISDEMTLQAFLMLYAYVKRLASAHQSQKKLIKEQQKFWQEALIEMLGSKEFKRLWTLVEAELDTLVRASSMVENVNSRLRRFLKNSRGQVNQNRLNLIKFYFNNKLQNRGKRARSSAIQRIKGETEPVPWLDALKKKVEPLNV